MSRRLLILVVGMATAMLAGGSTVAVAGSHASSGSGRAFVTRDGKNLRLDGKTFQFAGANNYYLMYKSPLMVDDVFADAQAAGFNVVRTWGFLDIGNEDGSDSVRGIQDGTYFQYWDGDSPAFNDGPTGLEKLDYVLYSARQHGIRLVIPLTNNWNDFGGMDQYVRWRDRATDITQPDRTWYHDDFYTDPVIRGWYQDWISHVLNRENTITGIKYSDDPTVMAWELGNEPRCLSAGAYGRSPDCTTDTLIGWADEMTRHIKSIDTNHLTSVGDEGFFCDEPGHEDWTRGCGEGVDTIAFARLPAVDLMSFHIYVTSWGKDLPWSYEWIRRHVREANKINKPVMWGEFGWLDKSTRNTVFKTWTDIYEKEGGDGWTYWILSGIQDDGTLYPDFDGYTVYCPSPVCTTLSNAGADLRGEKHPKNPVADHDTAVVEFNHVAALTPAANDIAYVTAINPSTVDLDPATSGQQSALVLPEGTFDLGAGGVVTFAPADGFVGTAVAPYQIRDEAGRKSNVADISVTVKPDPAAAILITSFEDGSDDWHAINGPQNGTASQTSDYATDGIHSLLVDTTGTGGDWFGRNLPAPLDLTGKTVLQYDLRTLGAGTSLTASLQVGNGFEWCQWPFGEFLGSGQTRTVELDLISGTSCTDMTTKLADVRAIWIWVAGGGQFNIDNVRAL